MNPLKIIADYFAFPGAHEEIDYSAKLKFSDDEGDEEGEEEQTESSNDSQYENKFEFNMTTVEIVSEMLETNKCFALDPSEQQMTQEVLPAGSRSRASDSSEDAHHTPSSNTDKDSQPPSSKPGWAEEGGNGWQGGPTNYQVDHLNCGHMLSDKACSNGEKSPNFVKENNAYVLLGKRFTLCFS